MAGDEIPVEWSVNPEYALRRAAVDARPADTDAWIVFIEVARMVGTACYRDALTRVVRRFPMAADYWIKAVELEMGIGEFGRAANLFGQCLPTVLDVGLFIKYTEMIKIGNCVENVDEVERVEKSRDNIQRAFEFAIARVGVDPVSQVFFEPGSGRLFLQYIEFLKHVPATRTFSEAHRTVALRKVYQMAVTCPIDHIEDIWAEYDEFEMRRDPVLAAEIQKTFSGKYMAARANRRERHNHLARLDRHGLPRARNGGEEIEDTIRRWKNYVAYEAKNPMRYDPAKYYRRMCFVYNQAAGPLYLVPEIWHDAAQFCAHSDGNTAVDDAAAFYNRGMAALPECPLIGFLTAEFFEDRNMHDRARDVYTRLIKNCDTPVVHIQRMRAERRMGLAKGARQALVDAMKSKNCTYHVYVHGARMEYHANKQPEKALAIFEAGMQHYAGVQAYIVEYIRFLTCLNDENKLRALFEHALCTLPTTDCADVWTMWEEFEYNYGGRREILRLEERRADTYAEFADNSMRAAMHRFRAQNLMPAGVFDVNAYNNASRRKTPEPVKHAPRPRETPVNTLRPPPAITKACTDIYRARRQQQLKK